MLLNCSTDPGLAAPIVQAADWVGLVAMSATTAVLGYKLLAFKPPPSANATRKYVSCVPQ